MVFRGNRSEQSFNSEESVYTEERGGGTLELVGMGQGEPNPQDPRPALLVVG